MKIELDNAWVDDFRDSVMISLLKHDLAIAKESLERAWHDGDKKYNKKLIKAYHRILDYYGVKEE